MTPVWDLTGAVAVVTGAGSGIGRALAVELGGRGCRLVLVDRSSERLAATAALVAGATAILTTALDVTDRDALTTCAAEVVERFGGVDLVVNNAGIAHGGVDVVDLPLADLRRVLDVNLWGVIHGTQVFLPHLIARPRAAVVNISSVYGLAAVGGQAAYCASKFAVRGFTESLRMELRVRAPHVRAVVVHPGGVRTAIARDSLPAGQDPAERAEQLAQFESLLRTSPGSAARTIVDGVRRGRDRIRIGPDAVAGDLLARIAPRRYSAVLLAGFRRAGLDP